MRGVLSVTSGLCVCKDSVGTNTGDSLYARETGGSCAADAICDIAISPVVVCVRGGDSETGSGRDAIDILWMCSAIIALATAKPASNSACAVCCFVDAVVDNEVEEEGEEEEEEEEEDDVECLK